jgi:RNA polymerase sigma-32 factor
MTPSNDSAPDVRRAYFADIQQFPVLDRDEEKTLAERYRAGDEEAGDRLVVANLRLVAKVASEFRRFRVPFMDLLQEGNIGLLQAKKKYDPSFGTKFSTYAAYWIRAYMLMLTVKNYSLVRLGTTQPQRRIFFRLSAARRELANRTGASDDPVALAALIGASPKAVAEMMIRMGGDMSLSDVPSSDDGRNASRLDSVLEPSPAADTLLEEAETAAWSREAVRAALETLDARERFIVENRSMSDEPMTLKDLGRRLGGLSRERVRQLQLRAHEKIRRHVTERSPS